MKKITQEKLRAIMEAILKAKTVLVLCSKDPAGDTIGSQLALGHTINFLGKDVTFISPDGVPSHLQILPGSELIYSERDEKADLAVWVDRSGDGELGSAQKNFERSKDRVKLSPADCGSSMALGELVLSLIRALGVDINQPLALCLEPALERTN